MSVDLTFRNNQNFLLVYNVSQWALIYDFTTLTFRMQIRSSATDPLSIYAFASYSQQGIRGAITFLPPNLLLISAPYSDVRTYLPAGNYVHDLTIEADDPLTDQTIVIRAIAAGALKIEDGVTLR